jgi:hypothetical protein
MSLSLAHIGLKSSEHIPFDIGKSFSYRSTQCMLLYSGIRATKATVKGIACKRAQTDASRPASTRTDPLAL